MSSKQRCRISLPISIDCDEDYECGGGIGSEECCEALLAGQERIISGQDQIIKLLSQMKDCVCDCGGGNPETEYKGEAIGVILPESGKKSGTALYRVDKDIESVDSIASDYFNKHPLWSGIVREEIDGQVMVKIPAFAYKRGVADSGSNEGKRYLVLAPADTTESGFERHPAFMKDGQPIDCFWVGAYQACVDPADAGKLGSRPGTMPFANADYSTMLARIQARNNDTVLGFMMCSIYQWAAIQMLYLVEYADTNSQTVIGKGNSSGSAGAVKRVDDAGVATSTYRGMVGLWGNIWQRIDGLLTDADKKVQLWKRDGTQVYETTPFVMPAVNLDPTKPSYMVEMELSRGVDYNFADVFIPSEASTSASSSNYADGFFGSVAFAGFFVGGSFHHGYRCGIFCTDAASPASFKRYNLGTRIAKI